MAFRRGMGVVLLLIASTSARGWNDTGHMVIALATWDALSADERTHFVGLLRTHPRYQQDFIARFPRGLAASGAAATNRWAFAMASTWPDYARSFYRASTSAAREQLMTRYHRSRWHYINVPTMLTPDRKWQRSLLPAFTDEGRSDPRGLNIVQALAAQRALLGSVTVADAERGIALCWVLHLVGDLHQPLHATALFARGRFDQGDRGGNELRVEPEGNLHALWDGALGTSRARRKLDQMVRALPDTDPGSDGSFAQWAREGQRIASREVYSKAIRTAVKGRTDGAPIELTLDASYRPRAARLAQLRAAIAVARLHRVLTAASQSP